MVICGSIGPFTHQAEVPSALRAATLVHQVEPRAALKLVYVVLFAERVTWE
jgi:hypothetical protein